MAITWRRRCRCEKKHADLDAVLRRVRQLEADMDEEIAGVQRVRATITRELRTLAVREHRVNKKMRQAEEAEDNRPEFPGHAQVASVMQGQPETRDARKTALRAQLARR